MIIISSKNQRYDIIIALSKYMYWFKLVSQLSDVAHGSHVSFSHESSNLILMYLKKIMWPMTFFFSEPVKLGFSMNIDAKPTSYWIVSSVSWFELHASIMINLNTLHWLLNWMFAAPVPCFMLPTCRKQKGPSWSVIRWPIRGDDCWSTFPNTLAIKRWIFCPPTTPWIRSSAQWHQMVSTLIGRGPSQ